MVSLSERWNSESGSAAPWSVSWVSVRGASVTVRALMRSSAEGAHALAEVAPAAQVPVGVHRLDPQRIDAAALRVGAAGAEVVEFDLHARG